MSSDFHNDREVVAKADHACCDCARTISPGDTYVRSAGLFDGEFYAVTACVRCHRVRQKAWAKYGYDYDCDEGPAYGDLLEWIREARRQ